LAHKCGFFSWGKVDWGVKLVPWIVTKLKISDALIFYPQTPPTYAVNERIKTSYLYLYYTPKTGFFQAHFNILDYSVY
jgi:hypothetical protein